ncbi:MAG: Re/Si-specific NAD(P)(+) transhydrogenase subunit alpha [Proteobacteria bacterium]|nr:Re/Si-specific NAD(P)(+) transhydrogenase subunit alpha [Pseudomonadota bacterium]
MQENASSTLRLAVLRETTPNERRVALVPALVTRFRALGLEPVLESGAGAAAGIPDSSYSEVRFEKTTVDVIRNADLLLCVQPPPDDILATLPSSAIVVGLLQPFQGAEKLRRLAEKGITSFAMELVPRISRAQSMDALSSQAACAGYQAALIAASELDRFLPMLTTAAGTVRPARVLVVGAGVAGLQAIATARRLGAQVEGFDVRSATREQVESLGAKFVDTGIKAEGEGGYARELTDDEKRQQQDVLAKHVAMADAIITTAAIPGRPAPKILTSAMVDGMKAGAVVVDIAAETGGNCELTRAGEAVSHGSVRIIGPLNLPSRIAEHASEMYSRNLLNLITPWFKDGKLNIDWNDEVYAKSVLTRDGEMVFEPARKLLA